VKETGQLDGVICDCVSFALSGANVRYEIDLVQDLWPVDFDNGQISQVLNNVLINAVQAMPEGGDIRIRARNLARGSVTGTRVVEINIEDTGSGIPEEAIEQIFDPYFSTRQDGQGLGLATAHSIVRRHDGELTVTSVSGQGTTFRIRLPASDNLAPVPAIPERPTPERRSGGRVLVVDDDADVRSTIEAMLRSLDYEVVCAAEGGKGLDLYGESLDAGNRFDAVILDLTIRGGMGGRETIGHLLELDPDAGAIVVSGYSSDPVMADFEAYGFRARVSKPFLRADLQSALEQILDP
ncbi:MAG: response regulator, partial [bacterium]|nr:response regulator [bacterium]